MITTRAVSDNCKVVQDEFSDRLVSIPSHSQSGKQRADICQPDGWRVLLEETLQMCDDHSTYEAWNFDSARDETRDETYHSGSFTDLPLFVDTYNEAVDRPRFVGECNNEQDVRLSYIYEEVRKTGLPNFLGARIALPHKLNMQVWRSYLTSPQDVQLCDFLEFGFPLNYCIEEPPVTVFKNHTSAEMYPKELTDLLIQRLSTGRSGDHSRRFPSILGRITALSCPARKEK